MFGTLGTLLSFCWVAVSIGLVYTWDKLEHNVHRLVNQNHSCDIYLSKSELRPAFSRCPTHLGSIFPGCVWNWTSMKRFSWSRVVRSCTRRRLAA